MFFDNFLFTFNAVSPVFCVIFIGFILRKIGLISESFSSASSKLVFNICLPLLIFLKLYKVDIQEVIKELASRNIGILITDHNVRETLGITDRAYIMNEGKILVDGTPDFIINSELAKKVYLGDQFKL